MSINENLTKLLDRLETTEIPTVTGQLRYVSSEGQVRMCPLGHLVDMWIEKTEGAHWTDGDPAYYLNPICGYLEGFPPNEILGEFGLDAQDAYRIYRENDGHGKTPAEVAKFIREELI